MLKIFAPDSHPKPLPIVQPCNDLAGLLFQRLLIAVGTAVCCPNLGLGRLVPDAGFEPATFGLQNRCSTN